MATSPAELLPKTPSHVGVCLIGGDRPLTRSVQGDRLVVGKACLIQRLGAVMRSGELTVADHAPGRELLRKELAQFVFEPGVRGRLRLEAARAMTTLLSRRRWPFWRRISQRLAAPGRVIRLPSMSKQSDRERLNEHWRRSRMAEIESAAPFSKFLTALLKVT